MVDALGHLGIALLVAAPAWVRWDGRVSLAFVGYGLLTALAPDLDRLLPGVPVGGPTHTVAFVAALALVLGGVIAVTAERVVTRWWFEDEHCLPARTTIYAFTTAGLLLGGLSHLAADLLFTTAPIRPLVPLLALDGSAIAVDALAPVTDPAWTLSLLVVAVSAHVGLFLVDRQ